MKNYFSNVLLEVLLIVVGVGLYYVFPFVSFFFEGFDKVGFYENVVIRFEWLFYFSLGYLILIPLLAYYKVKKGDSFKIVKWFSGIVNGEFKTQLFLSFLLKFLFIPMMFFGMMEYSIHFYETFIYYWNNGLPSNFNNYKVFNQVVFPLYLDITLAIAVAVYLFGYCVEHDKLGSKIKSIDSTWFGWIVTIMCYAPIFFIVFYVIPKGDQEFAFFKNEQITAIVRSLIMLVVLFKTWTIFALGTKSSNLTNRGIVTTGPYKLMRHPHYLAKLIVWWIGVIPSGLQYPQLFGGMIFWTTIYVLSIDRGKSLE